jgi:hypothetical protein
VLQGPRLKRLRTKLRSPRSKVHGAGATPQRPQRTGRCYTVHGPSATDQRPQCTGATFHGPRTSVLGPALQRPLSGNAENVEASCWQATSPNENRPSRIWRPNKIGACLQQGGPKRGGGGPAGGVFIGMERLQLPPQSWAGLAWGGRKLDRVWLMARAGYLEAGKVRRAKDQGPSTQCHNAVVVAPWQLCRGPWLCRAGLAECRLVVLGPWILDLGD